MKLFDWLFGKKKEETPQDIMVALVLRTLDTDPDGWKITEHHAIYRDIVDLWVANRPYADLAMFGVQIGNKKQREIIRAKMDEIRVSRLVAKCSEVNESIQIDEAIRSIERLTREV